MLHQHQAKDTRESKQPCGCVSETLGDLRSCKTLGVLSGFVPDRKSQFVVRMCMDIQSKQYRALVHQRSMDAPQRFETRVVDIRETAHRVMKGDVVWDGQGIVVPLRVSNWDSDSECRNYEETMVISGSPTMPSYLYFESERSGYFTLTAEPDIPPFGGLDKFGGPNDGVETPAAGWIPWVVGGAVVITLGCMGIAAAADCQCHASASWENKDFDIGLNCN